MLIARAAILSNPPFSPLMLGASLLAWWDADRTDLIGFGSGLDVESWADRKAGLIASQITAGSRPLYGITAFNGTPGITFDGVADCLLLNAPPFPDGFNSSEIWAVIQQDALAADTTVRYIAAYGEATTSVRRLERTVVTGTNRARANAGNGTASNSIANPTIDLSSRHLVQGIYRPTQIGVAVDGNEPSMGPCVPATSPIRFRIGAAASSTTASGFHQGKMRDVVVTRELTPEQTKAMNAWGLVRRAL